jgi:hypothetical protein
MADPPHDLENEEDTGVAPDRGAATRTARWIVALGITVAIALVALVILLHLTGAVGPGAH